MEFTHQPCKQWDCPVCNDSKTIMHTWVSDHSNVVWQPTMHLRWKIINEIIEPITGRLKKVLLQKWISNMGAAEWREINF